MVHSGKVRDIRFKKQSQRQVKRMHRQRHINNHIDLTSETEKDTLYSL